METLLIVSMDNCVSGVCENRRIDCKGFSCSAALLHSDKIVDIGRDPIRLKAKSIKISASTCFFGINLIKFKIACGLEEAISTGEFGRPSREPKKFGAAEERGFIF